MKFNKKCFIRIYFFNSIFLKQYCDILVEEIQEMLRKLPDPLPGTKCDPKLGWLPNGFDAQCREIINRQIRAELRKQNNIPEDRKLQILSKRECYKKLFSKIELLIIM